MRDGRVVGDATEFSEIDRFGDLRPDTRSPLCRRFVQGRYARLDVGKIGPWCVLADGVKRTGTKRTPGKRFVFKAPASARPSTHGAPTTSKGVSVPRPTETFVVSSSPIPG